MNLQFNYCIVSKCLEKPGIKVRGIFSTRSEAEARIKELSSSDLFIVDAETVMKMIS